MITDAMLKAANDALVKAWGKKIKAFPGPSAFKWYLPLTRIALEAGLAAAWQPIETAPKDGTKFLGTTGRSFFILAWDGWEFQDPEGFGESSTHWMPLPEAPE